MQGTGSADLRELEVGATRIRSRAELWGRCGAAGRPALQEEEAAVKEREREARKKKRGAKPAPAGGIDFGESDEEDDEDYDAAAEGEDEEGACLAGVVRVWRG